MTAPENAAVARLEERVAHLIDQMDAIRGETKALKDEIKGVRTTLDEGAGGMKVLRWFVPTSLAGAIALGGVVYSWFKS
jgi:hypothetical protein